MSRYNFFIVTVAVGLGWEFVLRYKNCIATEGQGGWALGRAGRLWGAQAGAGAHRQALGVLALGAQAGRRRAGRTGRHGRQQGARGAPRRPCVGRAGRGRQGAGRGRTHGRAAGHGRRAGVRQGTTGARADAQSCYRAQQARGRAAGARGARGLGAWRAACAHRLGQLGARAPDLVFNLFFFYSVFFLSHQMNSVHCKINFEKKYIFIKFK